MSNEYIFNEIQQERKRQTILWGPLDDNSPKLWCNIMGKQFGQANHSVLKARNANTEEEFDQAMATYRKKLIQLAAVCAAAIEEFDIKTKEQ